MIENPGLIHETQHFLCLNIFSWIQKMIRKDNYKIYVSQKRMINLRVFKLVPETMSITLTNVN